MRYLVALLLVGLLGTAPASTKTVDVSHPIESGGAVRVDIRYGKIRIQAADTQQVRVRGEISEELTSVSVRREAGAIEIRARFPFLSRLRGFSNEPSTYAVDLVIEVPASTRLFVVSRDADLEISEITGPIGIGVVTSSVVVTANPARLDFEAISGSLTFAGSVDRLRAKTLSGELSVTGAVGQVELDAVTGAVAMDNPAIRQADLTTVSGAVDWRGGVLRGGSVNIETESGEVRIHCCQTNPAQLEMDLSTEDSEIINQLTEKQPRRDSKGRRVLREAGESSDASMTVRTQSGLIWLLPDEQTPD